MIAINLPNSDEPACRTRGRGRGWIVLILGLILMNMGIVATTIYFAASDRSGGVEPNYYAQALNYDSVISQRSENARLGWKPIAALVATSEGSAAVLTITILDRDGAAVRDALVRVVAFPSLRSAERSTLVLRQSEQGYSATVPLLAKGAWRVRMRATRGADCFTNESDVMLEAATGNTKPTERTQP